MVWFWVTGTTFLSIARRVRKAPIFALGGANPGGNAVVQIEELNNLLDKGPFGVDGRWNSGEDVEHVGHHLGVGAVDFHLGWA
jgi:hypothetical protein